MLHKGMLKNADGSPMRKEDFRIIHKSAPIIGPSMYAYSSDLPDDLKDSIAKAFFDAPTKDKAAFDRLSDGQKKGFHAATTKDWDGTIVKIDKIINELKPTGTAAADMLVERARAHVKLSQWDKAEADYTRALELKPSDDDLRIERGRFFEKRGQSEKAAADFTAAVDPKKRLVETSPQSLWWATIKTECHSG